MQKTNGVTEESAQFVRTNGKWMYDPNVEITLPGGKGVEISTKYYQACVDWYMSTSTSHSDRQA